MIERIVVGGPASPWEELGLVVDDGMIALRGTSIAIDAQQAPGIVGWEISDLPAGIDSIDGLPTRRTDAADLAPAAHPLGVTGIDHVVISTDSIERTCAAIAAATGAPLKRIRDAGRVRQGFHRIGALIVEVVEIAEQPVEAPGFWGLAFNVEDLDAAVEVLGPQRVSPAKDAVQRGRRIASVRPAAGLGLPVALMSRAAR